MNPLMNARLSTLLLIFGLFASSCVPPSNPSKSTITPTVLAEPSATPTLSSTATQAVTTDTPISKPKIPLPVSNLPATLGLGFIYDQALGQVTAFGGRQNGVCDYCADTWVWDFTTWTKAQPSSHPEGRLEANFVYDPVSKVSVLFGGMGQNSFLGDTWLWNGKDWQKQNPAVSPLPRSGAAMAYDETRQVIMLFGGQTTGSSRQSTPLNDTWIWDGKTWTELHPTTRPPAESGNPISMAFDATHQNMVLIDQGTWIFDGKNWAKLYPDPSPQFLTRGSLGYDKAHKQMVYVSGDGDAIPAETTAVTWIWDGAHWTSVLTPKNLNGAGIVGLSDDPRHKVLLMFVDRAMSNQTNMAWAWDGIKWEQIY